MAFLNRVMLIGRLTDNPEPPRTLPNSGSTVVKFRFAVGRSKKNQQTGQWENDPNPLYIDCEAFSKPDGGFRITDVITNYCTKGKEIYLEGRLQYDTWDDKNNPGQKRSKHKIVVDSIQLLGPNDRGGGGGDEGGGGGGYQGGGGGYQGGGGQRPPQRGPAPQQQPPRDQHDDHGGAPDDGGDIPF